MTIRDACSTSVKVSDVEMAGMMGDFRKWDELIPDALALIFKKLSLCESLTVVPAVCKSWQRVVIGPYCWQEIDLEEWCKFRQPELIDRMLQLLLPRTAGSLRKLSVYGVTCSETIALIANHAQSLQELRLLRCCVNEGVIKKAAPKLSNITRLDFSYSYGHGITPPDLRAIGKHCKSLTSLNLTQVEPFMEHFDCDHIMEITSTMLNLKNLLIADLAICTVDVEYIIENCKNLEYLDITGCHNTELDKEFVKRFPNLKISAPGDMKWLDDFSDDGSYGGFLDDPFYDDYDYEDYADSAADLYYPGIFDNAGDTDRLYAALFAEELADDLDHFL